MSRGFRIKAKVLELLEEHGPLNTAELYDEINRLYRHGTTMSQLTNMLRGRAVIVGQIDTTRLGVRCRYHIWDVKQNPTPPQDSKY